MSSKSEEKVKSILETIALHMVDDDSIPKLAGYLGVTKQALYSWRDAGKIPIDTIKKKIPNINPVFLRTGKGEIFIEGGQKYGRGVLDKTKYETTFISYYGEVRAAAGSGLLPVNEQTIDIEFSRLWLKTIGIGSSRIAIIRAQGDSMYPLIKSGDYLFVDKDETVPNKERPYVVVVGKQLLVKYVYQTGVDKYVLKGTDENHPAGQIEITPEEGYFQIIGQVRHIQRTLT